MNYCDMTCKYARFAKRDLSGACRTWVAIYCNKKKMLVYKNTVCSEYIPRKKDE